MPDLNLFTGTTTTTPTESRYATVLHELGHYSGASHRLNREFGERFGDKKYAFEEIVVEIAAAYNCAHLEITNTPRPDHAQYIAHWLEILKGDKKAIFTAASLASQIINRKPGGHHHHHGGSGATGGGSMPDQAVIDAIRQALATLTASGSTGSGSGPSGDGSGNDGDGDDGGIKATLAALTKPGTNSLGVDRQA